MCFGFYAQLTALLIPRVELKHVSDRHARAILRRQLIRSHDGGRRDTLALEPHDIRAYGLRHKNTSVRQAEKGSQRCRTPQAPPVEGCDRISRVFQTGPGGFGPALTLPAQEA